MSEETDILIERKEAELLPLRSRMEELKTEFTKQTVDFAFKWYRKTAKEYITKYPEITLNMSEEKIANMKAKVNELVKNAEKIVRDELDNPALWWHQKPNLHDPIDQYKQVADKYPEILDHAVRHILGHLGMVLEEFGFHVTTSSNTGAYKEFWFELPIGGKQTVPCYPHLLSWTEEMQDTIREYDAQFTQAITLYNEIQQLKEEKKRQEALTRWDSI
jgi:predicted DNA binding CopG/RHH family protein